MSRRAAMILISASITGSVSPTFAGMFAWNGAGGDSNWTSGANWGGAGSTNPGTAPGSAATDDLVFSGVVRLTPVADVNSPWVVNSLAFDATAGAFALSGNQIRFAGASSALTQGSASAQSIANTIDINTATTFGGNGAGVVTLSGGISGSGALTKSGSSTFDLTAGNSYAGAVTVSGGTLKLSGANGSLASASGYTLSGGTFLLDNATAAAGARLNSSATMSMAGGTLSMTGVASGTSSESVATVSLASGYSTLSMAYGTNGQSNFSAGNLSRPAGGGTLFVSGLNLGKDTASTTNVSRVKFTTTPTLVGTTGAATTGITTSKNTQIVPWLVGESGTSSGNTGTASGTPNTFVTYNASTGLRPLNLTDEFTNNSFTTGNNARITSNTNTPGSRAINSLILAGGNVTLGNSDVLTITSGAMLFVTSQSISGGNPQSNVAFGSAEAIITANSGVTGTLNPGGSVTGTGGLTKSGPGTLALSKNSITGATSIQAGTLRLSSTTLDSASGLFIAGQGTFDLNTQSQTVATLTGTGTIGSSSTTGASTITVSSSSSSTFDGTIVNTLGSGTQTVALTKSGTGTFTLTNTSSSYTGATTVANGTLSLASVANGGSNSLIGAAAASTPIVLGSSGNTGVFQYTGASGATNRQFTLASSGTGAFDVGGSLTLNGAIGGSGALQKRGSGTLTLSTTNGYTGTTSVLDGTLLVTGATSSSSTGSNTVTIGNPSTAGLLPTVGGTGAIGGTLSVLGPGSGSAGRVAPGVGGIGTLNVGTLTLANGSILNFDFGGKGTSHTSLGSSDWLNATSASVGALAFPSGGSVTLNIASGSGNFTGSGTYLLMKYAAGATVTNFSSGNGSTGSIVLSGAPSGLGYSIVNDATNRGIYLDFFDVVATTYNRSASVGVANAGSGSIIVGGSIALTSTITNSGTGLADTINVANLRPVASGGTVTAGTPFNGTVANNSTSASSVGYTFSAASPGSYTISPDVDSVTHVLAPGAPTESPAAAPATLTVLDHASASLSGVTAQASQTINFGGVLRGANVASQGFTIYNLPTNTTAANTVDLKMDAGTVVAGDAAISTTINAGSTFTGKVAGGAGQTYSTSLNTASYGSFSKTITVAAGQLLDDSTLSGAGQAYGSGLTVTASGTVGEIANVTSATLHDHASASAALTATITAGVGAYAGLSSRETNGLGTEAIFVDGNAGAGRTVAMQWRGRNADEINPTYTNPPIQGASTLMSDVVWVTGTGGDTFILKVSYDPSLVSNENLAVANGWIRLMWLDPKTGGYDDGLGISDDQYFFATDGAGGTFQYMPDHTPTLADGLGAFGVDRSGATHYAWAIVNRDGQFAVVPEPMSLSLFAVGSLVLLRRRRR